LMQGAIKKMKTALAKPVQYQLPIGDQFIDLNPLIGSEIQLSFVGQINCIHCGRSTKKSFQQGYCFPCYRELGACHYCMIHPERCLHGEGSCNPDHWVHANCMTSQIVYLANSSGLKVGVTRETQIPTRWIDQGAVQALPIFRASNRYQAGVLEVALKAFVADKTQWRVMLKNQQQEIDLTEKAEQLLVEAKNEIHTVITQFKEDDITSVDDSNVIQIDYPVLQYPQTIQSFNFDKEDQVRGILEGIKGQYLLFDTGVINMRKFGGYNLIFES